MAQIEGFRGIRFSLENGCDVSDRLAPPYDTIYTDEDKRRLLDRSEHNIVAVDLPHTPPRTAGPEYLYRQAGELLDTWLKQNVLIQDIEPAVYLYRQTFNHAGKTYIRRGFIARLRLEEFGEGHVLPHEKTYSGPKEDRLLLTRHARAYISQIFCLYEDHDNEIADTLYAKTDTTADYHGTLAGVNNEVWVITERGARHWLAERMADRAVFIADGHHRYSTALMYRDHLAERAQLHENHGAHYTAAMFVSMSEAGLLVLPTHRVIVNLNSLAVDDLVEPLSRTFNHRWLDAPKSPDEWTQAVDTADAPTFALVQANQSRVLIVWPKDPQHLLDDLADRYTHAWRTLPVAILHEYILDRVIYPKWLAEDTPRIEYFHDAADVETCLCDTPHALGVIVPPTSVEAVREICSDRLLMPQKSTFFYPKIATGLVLYPMFD